MDLLADVATWRSFAREPPRGLQRTLRRLLEDAERDQWWVSAPAELAAMSASSSGWGAGVALLRRPTERLLQLSDADVRIAVCERLCVDLTAAGECSYTSRAGNVCGRLLRGGAHSHCCGGTAGGRITQRHNPLVHEFARILIAAGRNVATEQRDPSMGPNARLDIVEYASDVGAPAAYDVSVVTPLREDANFRESCACEPGLAAERRHAHKLGQQYARRLPGTTLVPLVVEIGGRWHPSVPRLVRRLAKDAAGRSPVGDPDRYSAALTARWRARLSALLIRGNAAVQRACQPAFSSAPRPWSADTAPLPHSLPEDVCAYELLCGQPEESEED